MSTPIRHDLKFFYSDSAERNQKKIDAWKRRLVERHGQFWNISFDQPITDKLYSSQVEFFTAVIPYRMSYKEKEKEKEKEKK